jgi:hypothetical protein
MPRALSNGCERLPVGWIVTRNRPVLRWLHILSLLYSILIENVPWPCPLTLTRDPV